jgi:hypothetical protein
VQWIFLLNTVPDLELITYLPEFLDGLFIYLSDPNVDVRTATLNLLAEFLKEVTLICTNLEKSDIEPSPGSLDFGKMTGIPC